MNRLTFASAALVFVPVAHASVFAHDLLFESINGADGVVIPTGAYSLTSIGDTHTVTFTTPEWLASGDSLDVTWSHSFDASSGRAGLPLPGPNFRDVTQTVRGMYVGADLPGFFYSLSSEVKTVGFDILPNGGNGCFGTISPACGVPFALTVTTVLQRSSSTGYSFNDDFFYLLAGSGSMRIDSISDAYSSAPGPGAGIAGAMFAVPFARRRIRARLLRASDRFQQIY